MAECRRGVGAHCNCSEELVTLFMSRLSSAELEILDAARIDVVLDSIAEAHERKNKLSAVPFGMRER